MIIADVYTTFSKNENEWQKTKQVKILLSRSPSNFLGAKTRKDKCLIIGHIETLDNFRPFLVGL